MDKTIKGKWQQKESGGGNSNIRQAKTSDKKQEDRQQWIMIKGTIHRENVNRHKPVNIR